MEVKVRKEIVHGSHALTVSDSRPRFWYRARKLGLAW